MRQLVVLKTALKHRFGTSRWVTLARERPQALVAWLDADFTYSGS